MPIFDYLPHGCATGLYKRMLEGTPFSLQQAIQNHDESVHADLDVERPRKRARGRGSGCRRARGRYGRGSAAALEAAWALEDEGAALRGALALEDIASVDIDHVAEELVALGEEAEMDGVEDFDIHAAMEEYLGAIEEDVSADLSEDDEECGFNGGSTPKADSDNEDGPGPFVAGSSSDPSLPPPPYVPPPCLVGPPLPPPPEAPPAWLVKAVPPAPPPALHGKTYGPATAHVEWDVNPLGTPETAGMKFISKIRYDTKLQKLAGHCRHHGTSCRMQRGCVSSRYHPEAGRPLGLIVAWLACATEFDDADSHMKAQRPPNVHIDERVGPVNRGRWRSWLKAADLDTYLAITEHERPKTNPGDESETDEVS